MCRLWLGQIGFVARSGLQVQGDWLDVMPDFILKSFGASKGITKKDVYFVDNKKKVPFYDDEDE